MTRFSKLFTMAILLATFAGFSSWHLFELLAHFRPIWLVAGLFLVCFWLLMRRLSWVFLTGSSVLVNAWLVMPWYLVHPQVTDEKLFSVMLSNVNSANPSAEGILQWIDEKKPDLIIVQEMTPVFASQLSALRQTYPFQLIQPENGNFGIGAFSKFPLRDRQVQYFGEANVPSLTFSLHLADKKIHVVASHPMPPITGQLHALRNNQLQNLAQWQSNLSESMILVGDMNTTVWGSAYAKFIDQTGLLNGRQGYGVAPTWPAGFPVLGLDHVLHTNDLRVRQFEVGPDIGSDHLPIWVGF